MVELILFKIIKMINISMKKIIFSIVFVLLTSPFVFSQNSPQLHAFSDNWVTTDGAGRTLPKFNEAGPYRSDKYIGVFYWLWHPYIRLKSGKPMTAQEVLNKNPDSPEYECVDYYWGEPEDGFYHASDPWVARRNLQMLANAGVDFIYIDFTNGDQGCKSLADFMSIALDMQKKGIPVPKIVFFMNESYNTAMNCVLDNFYNKPEYKSLMFIWNGKPLIMADSVKCKKQCKRCNDQKVLDMFTWRRTWAFEPGQWNFLDNYPQDYFSINGKPEQIVVSKAMGAPLWNADVQGSSYHAGITPTYDKYWQTDQSAYGYFFDEQWMRADSIDPSIVCITGWNELTAGAWPSTAKLPPPFMHKKWNDSSWRCVNPKSCLSKDSLGNHIPHGWYFVDEFNTEFNRDIEPMKGGYTDNYYYQMISHIRKYKGMSKQESASSPTTIKIDGAFSEWKNITPSFVDPEGDCAHRKFKNVNNSEVLINNTGRNDIILSKVTYDSTNIFFYVKTAANLTMPTDTLWMLLFIDIDKNNKTGWAGYDYLINHTVKNSSTTTVKFWDGKTWQFSGDARFRMNGSEMEISIPRKTIGLRGIPDFYFHWADNPLNLNDISSFFTNGESAPDRRFNYYFTTH